MKTKNIIKKNGQVALLVLLISAVVMTVGLSISKKTAVDTKIEADKEQLKQAFNTAESGIEYYLKTGETGANSFTAIDNSKADISVKNIGEGTTIDFNNYVLPGESVNYWMVDHNNDGNIAGTYYSGTELSLCLKNNVGGAIKLDYFYVSGGNYLVKRYGYNLVAGTVSGFNDTNLTQGNCSLGYNELPITLINNPILLAVKIVNSSGKMYLRGNANFPIQGILINSTGRVNNVNRSLEVKWYYQVPSFMTETITSYGSVLSN